MFLKPASVTSFYISFYQLIGNVGAKRCYCILSKLKIGEMQLLCATWAVCNGAHYVSVFYCIFKNLS